MLGDDALDRTAPARERASQDRSDEALHDRYAVEGRSVATNNVGDVRVLAQFVAEQGRHHAGLVFAPDASLPRTRATIGTPVERLGALLAANRGESSFVDRIHFPRALG